MALESATYIADLTASNPPAGDPVTQADDHIRLIKSVLQSTFPNLDAAVSSTPAQLNLGPVPTGGILLWYGSVASIPTGYTLCDGGTYAKTDGSGNITAPDLTDCFVMGAGDTYNPDDTGGSLSAITSSATSAGGSTGTAASNGSHTHTGAVGSTTLTLSQVPAHTHEVTASLYVQAAGYTNSHFAAGGSSAVYSSGYDTDSKGGGGSHTHTISSDGSHTHTVTVTADGTHTHTTTPVLPPYYALAYIMKL